MPKYILKRVLQSVLILLLVGLIIYGLLRCLPTSYIENMARQLSTQPGSKSFEEWMQQLEASYGLDKGIVPGYLGWLKNAVRFEFGDSWVWTMPVLEKFEKTGGISFVMGAIAFILELLIAIPAMLPVKNWLLAKLTAKAESGCRFCDAVLVIGPKVLGGLLLLQTCFIGPVTWALSEVVL